MTGGEVGARNLRAGETLVGLGSNLGDRAALMRQAYSRVLRIPGVTRPRGGDRTVSDLYETLPVAVDGEHEPFLNAAMRFDYEGEPEQLLSDLQEIEAELGRLRGPGVEPRTIDLDLLAVGPLERASAQLTLPHPRMPDRLFVLVPVCDFAAHIRHPGRDETFGELRTLAAARTPDPEKQVRRVADGGWSGSSSENASTGNR